MRQVCERIKGVDVLLFGIIRQLLSSLKLIVIIIIIIIISVYFSS